MRHIVTPWHMWPLTFVADDYERANPKIDKLVRTAKQSSKLTAELDRTVNANHQEYKEEK